MAGLVFLVCVPTASHEAQLEAPPQGAVGDNSDVLRRRVLQGKDGEKKPPLEKVLEDLLAKLEIDNAMWCKCRKGNYYQVIFPVSAGDQCENTLHFLSELGIGRMLNSLVSVLPCNVFRQDTGNDPLLNDGVEGPSSAEETKANRAWGKFVDSVRSKLTVAQVVDGVRSSGELTFDFVLLVVTAGMVAAMGLVENSSVNIVAAMLISPLMGPIVTATFGVVIADRRLQMIGIRTELTGLGLCLLFGFIFGLIIGSAENPWGSGDWPTTEMKGRGNYRSLWTGILVALPSGTGVALALLAGSAGPLIGVAISASLLPPVINCGMMWGLACNVLMYPETVRIPHVEGDPLTANWTSSYEPIYSDYIPSELAVLGCISFCLTLVNIACIFIAAIIVLKIKEVAAPYTSSPDMRRFWEHDIKVTREYNRSIMLSDEAPFPADRAHRGRGPLGSMSREMLEERLDEAVREAVKDQTFQKVRRVSYYQQSTPEVTEHLGLGGRGRPSLPHRGGGSLPRRAAPTPAPSSEDLRQSLLTGPPQRERGTPQGPRAPGGPLTRISRSLHLAGSRRRTLRGPPAARQEPAGWPGARMSLLPPGGDGADLPTIEEAAGRVAVGGGVEGPGGYERGNPGYKA
ncbi:uncharacterized protein [Hetaerina americana]|uniref:uncharacterized protein n=1 Tax=Hetaerina americana TaxID=62018 RepID=UPI003A7F5C72